MNSIHRWTALIFFVALCAAARNGLAVTYHVEQRVADADDLNDGSEAKPWKTIGHAAHVAQAGDTAIIGDGVYREAIKITNSGTAEKPIRFEAKSAANVVITGADRLMHLEADQTIAGVYSAPWNYDFISWTPTHTHPNDNAHLLVGRCEQVFINSQPLRQVLFKQQLSRGTFYVDLAEKRLFAWAHDNGKLSSDDAIVEASTRGTLWDCAGDYVETRGLRFRYAANLAQHGAGMFSGKHDRIEDCIFEKTNGVGAVFVASDITVRHCAFIDNGQLGFGAGHAHRLLMADCEIARNNCKGYSRGWEAGGDKLVLCRGAVIEHSIFRDNHGNGVWFDIGNEDCIVRNCLIDGNEDAGLFDEISYGLHASDNVIINNGLADTPGAWGAAGGICLSSSPNSVIERNLLIANKEGISFREQSRATPRIDESPHSKGEPIWNHNETIRHNVIAYNRDVQLRGWFDTDDQRHWPTAMQEKKQAGISLEILKFDLGDNVYAVHAGQSLFTWGVGWKRHKTYATPEEITRELNLEHGSKVVAIEFTNYAARDFRIPAESDAIKLGCFPRGEVPGVQIGFIAK